MIPGIMAMTQREPRDPYWGNVVSLLKFNGANGSTSFFDEKGKTWTAHGNAKISTAETLFGLPSMILDGNGDYISTPPHADFGFGTGDFTVEGFYRRSIDDNNARFLMDFRGGTAGASFAVWCSQNTASNRLGYSTEVGTNFLYGSFERMFPRYQFTHFAVTRQSGTIRGFTNGVLSFSGTDARNFVSPQGALFGSSSAANQGAYGYVAQYRVTKGVARYVANFTPPTAPFPNS